MNGDFIISYNISPEHGSRLQSVIFIIGPQSSPPFDASTKTFLFMNLFDAFPHVLLQLIHSSHSEAWQLTEIERIEILTRNWTPV